MGWCEHCNRPQPYPERFLFEGVCADCWYSARVRSVCRWCEQWLPYEDMDTKYVCLECSDLEEDEWDAIEEEARRRHEEEQEYASGPICWYPCEHCDCWKPLREASRITDVPVATIKWWFKIGELRGDVMLPSRGSGKPRLVEVCKIRDVKRERAKRRDRIRRPWNRTEESEIVAKLAVGERHGWKECPHHEKVMGKNVCLAVARMRQMAYSQGYSLVWGHTGNNGLWVEKVSVRREEVNDGKARRREGGGGSAALASMK